MPSSCFAKLMASMSKYPLLSYDPFSSNIFWNVLPTN